MNMFRWTMPTVMVALILTGVIGSAYSATYNSSIDGAIRKDSLAPAISTIQKAEKGDIVRLHINSPGGSTLEAEKLMQAIAKTDAMVVCYVRKYAASAAANILMTCHDQVVARYASILFHMGSLVKTDTKNSQTIRTDITLFSALNDYDIDFYKDYAIALYTKIGVKCILTHEEWDLMLSGEDIIFDGRSYNRRMNNACYVGG